MRALRTSCLNNSPIFHTGVLTIVIRLYIISPVFIYFIIKFVPFGHFQFSLLSPPTVLTANLNFFYEFVISFVGFLDSTYVMTCSTCLLVSDLLHLT